MALSQITFEFNETVPEEGLKKLAFNKKVPDEPALKSKRGRKSLKLNRSEIDLIEVPEDDILFKKMYYPIGDVAAMFRLNPSLIRYWENEFDILKPKKNAKGDRLFHPEDVKNLKLIYHLLRERKYTLEGAKDFLRHNKDASEKFEMIRSLQKIKTFLLELKTNL